MTPHISRPPPLPFFLSFTSCLCGLMADAQRISLGPGLVRLLLAHATREAEVAAALAALAQMQAQPQRHPHALQQHQHQHQQQRSGANAGTGGAASASGAGQGPLPLSLASFPFSGLSGLSGLGFGGDAAAALALQERLDDERILAEIGAL